MFDNGVFIISLDFQMQWGAFDKRELDVERRVVLKNTLARIVPKTLRLFEKYDMHATWAFVGMLLDKNKHDWQINKPSIQPKYNNPKLSSYDYFEKVIKSHQLIDKYFFADKAINEIYNTPHQELASHTYSHYYCLEEGQTEEQFAVDLEKAKRTFNENGWDMYSMVFPRNQFTTKNLEGIKNVGVQSIRTNPALWFWENGNNKLSARFFRLIDTYFSTTNKNLINHTDISKDQVGILELPSSRFFSAHIPNMSILNDLRLKRILNEMTLAAKSKKYYHIWWHPENFGAFPDQYVAALETILKHFKVLQNEYGFTSMTMKEYSEQLMPLIK